MGTCYSKKASGRNQSYITSPMASTKLDEASRLARPTPYARSGNANVDYATKKSIPLSTKYNSMSTVEHGEMKNIKNFQSSIPRFSSSLPIASGEQRILSPCNDNESLHVVNNNAIVNSRSAFNVSNTSPSNNSSNRPESLSKPKSVTSKSCPEKILSPDTNERVPRTPGKSSLISRQIFSRSPGNSRSHLEIQAAPKSVKTKETKKNSSRNSNGPNLTKSPGAKGSESRESLSDFDSGIGSSLTDKSKPEDSDTIKDLEQIEFQEEFSPNLNMDACINTSTSTPKLSNSDNKHSVKAPTYKRELNGKWCFDEKHFGPETTSRTNEPKPLPGSGSNSPKLKHSFKINASENIFSTYASYKGLLSYQKKSYKTPETNKLNPKSNSVDKFSHSAQPQGINLSSIPKIRKQASSPLPGGTVFYCHKEGNSCPGTENNGIIHGSCKQSSEAKQSSLDSDEKSDSTENGILSPPSDDNREFLIDDEISDQPGLTFYNDPLSEESEVQSLKVAVSELHALQMSSSAKKRTDSVSSYSSRKGRLGDARDSLILGSELGSSCSSIASDDLMLDYEKSCDGFPEGTINEGPASPMKKLLETETDKVAPLKKEKKFDFEEKTRKRLHRRSSGPLSASADRLEWRQRTVSLPLRPPRQMTVSEADDGGLKLDSSSYRLLCQDLNGVKTLLLRLKTVIQEAETINPFDQINTNNIFYHSLVQNDLPASLASMSTSLTERKTPDVSSIYQENADMRRQLVLLQQQLEEKDHTIHLLQQQMTKYLNVQGSCNHESTTSNAATQTVRSQSLSASLSSSSSADDSIETLVRNQTSTNLTCWSEMQADQASGLLSAQQDFEKSFKRNSMEQDVLTEHLIEVVRLLDRNSATYSSQSEC